MAGEDSGAWEHRFARSTDAQASDVRFSGLPGVALARELAACDPLRLDPPDAVAYLRATDRLVAWAQSLQDDALVAVAGDRAQIDVHELDSAAVTVEDAARSEVAAAMRWSDAWADERITSARLLHGPLPHTRAALQSGAITRQHADSVCTAAQRLSSYPAWLRHTATGMEVLFFRQTAELEQSVLPTARTRSVASTRQRADRALHRIDAAHAEHRRQQRRRQRDVWVQDDGDGCALLMARMGIAEAHACLSAVDALARHPRHPAPGTCAGVGGSPDQSTIGELRAEALAHLLLRRVDPGTAGGPDRPDAPDAPNDGGLRAHVDIVIGLDVLLGLADGSATLTGHGPGGPVPVSVAVVRDLLAADPSATMRRLVTDPLTGHLLDRGRTVYAVPRALREFLISRDGTCRFPGCGRRAALGQADHAKPWERGGATSRANTGMLCVRHHQLKTLAGWTIEVSAEDGSCRWRSPAGIVYDRPPPRLLSDE